MRRERSHVPPMGWQVRSVASNPRDGPERLAQVYALLLAPAVQPVQQGDAADARAEHARPENTDEHSSAGALSPGTRGVSGN